MKDTQALRRELGQQVDQLPERQLREVLDFVESLHRERGSSVPSIEAEIKAIVQGRDEAVWKNLPADGAKETELKNTITTSMEHRSKTSERGLLQIRFTGSP